MSADLSTVTVSDVIARRPCGDWSSRIPAFGERYRRETWSALEILEACEANPSAVVRVSL